MGEVELLNALKQFIEWDDSRMAYDRPDECPICGRLADGPEERRVHGGWCPFVEARKQAAEGGKEEQG